MMACEWQKITYPQPSAPTTGTGGIGIDTFSYDELSHWSIGPGADFLVSYKNQTPVSYYLILEKVGPEVARAALNAVDWQALHSGNAAALSALAKASGLYSFSDAADGGFGLRVRLAKSADVDDRINLANHTSANHTSAGHITAAEPAPAPSLPPDRKHVIVPLPFADDQVAASALVESARTAQGEYILPQDATGRPIQSKVLVGVIDDAINFGNHRFRTRDGKSRVDFAWVMDGKVRPDQIFPIFGREFTRQDIDDALARSGDDPDSLLRAFGLDPGSTRDRPVAYLDGSHGTHVADIAAGYPPDHSSDSIRMITAQLPALSYFDCAGETLGALVVQAVDYVLMNAVRIQTGNRFLMGQDYDLPVVINLSYGITGGPHSGGHYIERMIDQRVADFKAHPDPNFRLKNIEVVIPAGNSFLTRHNARTPRTSAHRPKMFLPVRLRVPPKDRTPNFLEFWLPRHIATAPGRGSRPRLWVKVRPPGCAAVTWKVRPGEVCELTQSGDVIARLSFDTPLDPNIRLNRILLCTAPTDTMDARAPRHPAPSGIWEVRVLGWATGAGRFIDAHIHREDPNFGFPRHDPTCYFDHPGYVRFQDGYGDWVLEDDPQEVVKRFGTHNGMGAGRATTLVGAYRIKSARQSLYSSATRDFDVANGHNAIDLMAAADLSRNNRGILATGTRSGSTFTLTGTSVAAPLVTRHMAAYLAGAPLGDARAHVRLLAAQYERVHAATLPAIPEAQRGVGRLPGFEQPGRMVRRGLYAD